MSFEDSRVEEEREKIKMYALSGHKRKRKKGNELLRAIFTGLLTLYINIYF